MMVNERMEKEMVKVHSLFLMEEKRWVSSKRVMLGIFLNSTITEIHKKVGKCSKTVTR